jgi:hypothetical protein
MNIAMRIKQIQHEITDHQISIKKCNEVLACADLAHLEPVDIMIVSIANHSKKSGVASLNIDIAVQCIAFQIQYHQKYLQMLEKELQELQLSNQF